MTLIVSIKFSKEDFSADIAPKASFIFLLAPSKIDIIPRRFRQDNCFMLFPDKLADGFYI